MTQLSFRASARPSDGASRALAAYVLISAAAAAAALVMVAREPDLATRAAPVPPPMVFLQDAEPELEPEFPERAARDALTRRARAGDAQAELTLGRLLAEAARRRHDLDGVSDAALWLDRARGHGRAEAALDLAELADRYCSRHELLADPLCAGD